MRKRCAIHCECDSIDVMEDECEICIESKECDRQAKVHKFFKKEGWAHGAEFPGEKICYWKNGFKVYRDEVKLMK